MNLFRSRNIVALSGTHYEVGWTRHRRGWHLDWFSRKGFFHVKVGVPGLRSVYFSCSSQAIPL